MFAIRFAVACLGLVLLWAQTSSFAQQPLPAQGDEAELLSLLKSEASLFDKAKACQRLAVIGTAESVPVLAELLLDKGLSHYARMGLETNPSSAVDEVLRRALGNLQGRQFIGVINSIGVRGDKAAVPALIKAAADDDIQVAGAALAALGRIATSESLAAIQQALAGNEALRVAAADACLGAADALLVNNRHAEAAQILAAVRRAKLPKHIKIASRFGEIRSSPDDLDQLMTRYLQAEDNGLFRIGLELAHGLTGRETTQRLLRQLPELPVPRQALLINVLGSRGDSLALPAVLAAAESDTRELRIAANRALATLGDRSAVPVLLGAAVSGDAVLAETARDSLAELNGRDVDAVLSNRLASSDGREQIVLIEAVGRRAITTAIPTLLSFVAADEQELRNAAIDALGLTVGIKELPVLVDQLLAEVSLGSAAPLKDALRKACQRMPDPDAAAGVLLERLADASPPAKAELMDLLIYVGGSRALAGLAAASRGADLAAADFATQALGKWLTPDAAPLLLELAQQGHQRYRIRCLRGYIRIIRQFGLPRARRLTMSQHALDAATRDQERRLVLDTLVRIPSPAALNLIMGHLQEPGLQAAASRSAVAICEQLVSTRPQAVAAALPKVVAATSDRELARRARVLLQRAKTQ